MQRASLVVSLAVAVVSLPLNFASLTRAQSVASGAAGGANSGPSFSYYYGTYAASTPYEGAARGTADVIRAYGESNLAHARAQLEWEAARRAQMENRLRAVQAYYLRREVYDQQREQERYEEREKLAARLAVIALQELAPEEFNPTTGQITWPRLLAHEAYARYRTGLEELFQQRAQYGALDPDAHLQAETLIREWRGVLTAARDYLPETQLREGLRFLLRLNRELEHGLS